MPDFSAPEEIRDVRFRQQVRGYHLGDVDEFVAEVAAAVEELKRRLEAAEARAAAIEAKSSESSDVEESLRRTLVLAQRTADLAIQEAREESARLLADAEAQRGEVLAEVEERRATLRAELEEETRAERERLHSERDALRADVEALDGHLSRERERLKIYFADQLRRIEQGEPGLVEAPAMQAPFIAADEQAPPSAAAIGDEGLPAEADGEPSDDLEDDPFLAELRRAVTDVAPLGPRDDPLPEPEPDDGFDLFAPAGDDSGRFGSRLRRRR